MHFSNASKKVQKVSKSAFQRCGKMQKTRQVPEGYFRPGPKGNTSFQVPSVVSKKQRMKKQT